MQSKTADVYKTKDFYSSCLLRALGFPLLGLDRVEARFVRFVFDVSEKEAEEILTLYWNRQLEVQAKDFVDAIHDMKNILYSK